MSREPTAVLAESQKTGATTPPLSIDEVVDRIDEISTLPVVALQVIQVARNPDSGAADLCAIVESDPALSSRMLKCVNSAAYGLRHRVSNLQRAISMLGFKQVRNLAVTASVSKVFRCNEMIGTYARPALWKHMVSVAVAARMIATRCQVAAFEEAFLAGLLHDIGIIVEDQYCHERFAATMHALDPERTLCEIEHECIGFDHTEIGAAFACKSGFPDEVMAAIRWHHQFESYHGQHANIVACVNLANFLCSVTDRTSVGMMLVKPSSAAMEQLNATRQDLKVWAADLDHELGQNKVLFNL